MLAVVDRRGSNLNNRADDCQENGYLFEQRSQYFFGWVSMYFLFDT